MYAKTYLSCLKNGISINLYVPKKILPKYFFVFLHLPKKLTLRFVFVFGPENCVFHTMKF